MPVWKCTFWDGMKVETVNIANVLWERVPEAGRRTAEGSRPYGSQVGRWCSVLDGRRGSESTGRCVERYEGARLWKAFKSEKYNLEFYMVLKREPMNLLKNRSDMIESFAIEFYKDTWEEDQYGIFIRVWMRMAVMLAVSDQQRQLILHRWTYADIDWVTLLICASKDNVVSKMTPRLLTWGEGRTMELSIIKRKVRFGQSRFSA